MTDHDYAPAEAVGGTTAAARTIGGEVGDPDAALPLIRGDTLVEQIDNLHHDMLAGSPVAANIDAWNLVHGFKERVKALIASSKV